jgi:alanyl-tRNA synthetase
VRTLEEIAARVEAQELIGEATRQSDAVRVVARVFDGRDADSLKHLALALVQHPGTIALLGARDNEHARLVFARSADADGDMNALMREACERLDGRGGGRADMAQGGGRNTGRLAEAIEKAAQNVAGE